MSKTVHLIVNYLNAATKFSLSLYCQLTQYFVVYYLAQLNYLNVKLSTGPSSQMKPNLELF